KALQASCAEACSPTGSEQETPQVAAMYWANDACAGIALRQVAAANAAVKIILRMRLPRSLHQFHLAIPVPGPAVHGVSIGRKFGKDITPPLSLHGPDRHGP